MEDPRSHIMVAAKAMLKKHPNWGLEEISEQMVKHKRMQKEMGMYGYDRVMEQIDACHAKIFDGHKSVDCIVWNVNTYLGLTLNERVVRAAQDAVSRYGTGVGTSLPNGGRSVLHAKIEQRLAKELGKEKVLLFPTGFTANLAVLGSLLSKGDLYLSDEGVHASIIQGLMVSPADHKIFNHNSPASLRKQLQRLTQDYKNVVVVVDSVYSMTGEFAPLREYAALRKEFGFKLYVDEAHAFGFYGKTNMGLCQELGVLDQVDFVMSSLSKSTGSIGGFVAMEEKYALYIEWSARTYLFQAAIPPSAAATILSALDEIALNPGLVKMVHDNAAHFRRRLQDAGFHQGLGVSPIIVVLFDDAGMLSKVCTELFENGIFTTAIAKPLAESNRLRFICSAGHSHADIDHTVDTLIKLREKHGSFHSAKL